MPCYKPLKAYRSRDRNSKGRYGITFSPVEGYVDLPVNIPCGQCIGCRLERARQWAMRCVHEAQMHEENCFITLTYSNSNLPLDGSLHVEHFQKFMKRVRKKHEDKKIRFFHCGEYGDTLGRPHYHAIIFGLDFRNQRCYNIGKSSDRFLKGSEELDELWPFGFNAVGDLTFESASYVARYITKKITGQKAFHHYNEVDFKTGEITKERKPEYTTMSRRPGIGHGFLKKYQTDIYPSDEVIMRGRPMKPPRYYDAQYEIINEEEMIAIKKRRQELSQRALEETTPERLATREKVALEKLKVFRRAYENG